jgi:DNA-directed RNA polymerase subunit beta
MGSNMQRQAVPLLYTQKPIVGTGLEAAAILDSGMIIKSYSEGLITFASSYAIKVEDQSNQVITYYLRKYVRSNQETAINQRPLVWLGEKVFSGQVIADGPSTNDGELSLGRNLTIAYMPWEGYNYEDAIVISERILVEDCLTSVHIEEYETSLSYNVYGYERVTKELPHLTKHIRRHLNQDGIVRLGSYVKQHDILVGKLTPWEVEPAPERKLLIALFGKFEQPYRDTSLRVSLGTEGRVVDIRILCPNPLNTKVESPEKKRKRILRERIERKFVDEEAVKEEELPFENIRIYIAQIRKIQIGDKLAGRHGNKGIVSRILPRQDMPYLPDGTPVDILFNPLGVPSRMNVGQVFECLLGLAGEKLGSRFKIFPFDEIYGNEASRILTNQKLKEAALKSNCDWLFNSYYPGKILLRDGRTGEYFDNPITVGKSYILKLIHLVEDKIHARATGPYAMITEQPLAGKSQKGGQRFGEMEVWAIEAYGASNTLQELLTIKSDDIDGRNDIYEAILVRKETEKPVPSIPESFLVLMRELNALGLDFSARKVNTSFSSNFESENIQENSFFKKEKQNDPTEKDFFEEMELRLKLRTLLARKKTEQFIKYNSLSDDNEYQEKKSQEKKKAIENFQKRKAEKNL